MFHNTRFLKRVIESDFFKCIHLRKKHEFLHCDILYENYLGLIKKENISFIALLPMAVWIKREFISRLVFQLYFLKKTERLETNSVSQVRVANNQARYGGLIWYHVYHQTENSCVADNQELVYELHLDIVFKLDLLEDG